MSRKAWILILLSACGEPVLRNAPKPNTAAIAGVAAATAAAVTLASPHDAAKQQEERKPEPNDRGVVVKETVPGAVFDRLDHAPADAGIDGGAPATPPSPAPPAKTAPAKSPAGKPAAAPPAVPAPQTWTPDAPDPR